MNTEAALRDAAQNVLDAYVGRFSVCPGRVVGPIDEEIERLRAALASKPDAAPAGEPERSVTLTGRQLRAALAWAVPDEGDADQLDGEVTIGWSDKMRDDDGVLQPPGYVLWFTDYPEEGCLPLDVEDEPASSAAPAGLASLRGIAAGSLPAGMTSEDVVESSRAGWSAAPAGSAVEALRELVRLAKMGRPPIVEWDAAWAEAEKVEAALAAAPVSPQGWVMVPLEPTQEMLRQIKSAMDPAVASARHIWRMALAAAPAALAVQPLPLLDQSADSSGAPASPSGSTLQPPAAASAAIPGAERDGC